MKRLREGNVYSKALDNGVTYYMHLIRLHPQFGAVCRIFTSPLLEPSSMVLGTLSAAIKDAIKIKGWTLHSWIQPSQSIGPLLWHSVPHFPNCWFFVAEGAPPDADYPGECLGAALPEKYRDHFIHGMYGIGYIEKMLVTGINIYDVDWHENFKNPLGVPRS